MKSVIYSWLLIVVAVVSGIAFLTAIGQDVYGPAWGFAFFVFFFFATIGSIVWGLYSLISSTITRMPPKTKSPDSLKMPRRRLLPPLFLFGAVLFVICYFMGTGCVDPSEYFWTSSCRNNLKTISLALFNYEQDHGCFPLAYIADETGKPMHSWRVLLLPYLGDWNNNKDLYTQYDFNEPWDEPNNRKLIENIPHEYICPEDEYSKSRNHKPGNTSYLAVQGDTGVWRGSKPVAFGDLKHNSHETVLLIETADSGIAWTEPRDVSLDEIENAANDNASSVNGISVKHRLPQTYFFNLSPGGVHVARADGSVSFVPANYLTPDKLKDILASGGCPDEFVYNAPYNFVNWWNCGVLFAFVASIYLLLRRSAK